LIEMADYGPPSVDFFGKLGAIGDSFAAARKEAQRKALLSGAVGADGGVDYEKLMAGALRAGDAQTAFLADRMRQDRRDFDWKKQESQRAQGNADREHALRERTHGIPSGFRQAPGGGLAPIPGGPNDPAYLRTKSDRQNAPAGYVWNDPSDPSKGLKSIPGGPAEKITPEVAARIGLGRSFLGQLEDSKDPVTGADKPGIMSGVNAGEATGPIDYLTGKIGYGRPGELHRQIASGAEALLRNLTGAGMNLTEAQEYVSRYRPSISDNSETLASKMTQLQRELQTVMETVGLGRGGALQPVPAAQPQQSPQMQGARRAADGNMYVPDPNRPGKYLMVQP
jgi:hypothetical protein